MSWAGDLLPFPFAMSRAMKYRSILVSHIIVLWILLGGGVSAAADPADKAGFDFFEAKIRPVLVRHCYQCLSLIHI